jgi:hypothetical protein
MRGAQAGMETDGDSALDGVTATPGVSAIPAATAPIRGSALRSFMLDTADRERIDCHSSARDEESHRHADSAHKRRQGRSRVSSIASR